MDNNELSAHIVKQLAEAEEVDDVIFDVCQLTGYDWDTAKALVAQVQQDREPEIVKKQFPLMFAVALIIFLGGLLLVSYGLYALVRRQTVPGDLQAFLAQIIEKRVDPVTGFRSAVWPYFYLFLYNLYNPISAILFGGAMIYGSLVGMRKVWSALLSRW
jgi:hypothetical protein